MSRLWEPRADYRRLEADSISGYYFGGAGFTEGFLPYKRLYQNLNEQDLRELLSDAKKFHWQILNLQRCGLDALPEDVWDLPDLKILYLGNMKHPTALGDANAFHTLPKSMEALSNLLVLQLSGSAVTELPKFIGGFKHLQMLFLTDCKISTLPDSIGSLTNLQSLSLSGTQISELPDSIGSLTNLQTLYLDGTQISELPDSIGSLTNLQSLYLGGTQISELPDSIGSLTNLKGLYLWATKISELPGSFANLTKLNYLYLDETPLQESLPPEVRGQSAQEIIRYVLERQSKAPKRYFNESKMVVVGQGSVGKSCVINRLLHDQFENQHTTEGIDIEYWTFTDERDSQQYTLNVWDFGGQEIYHATHQFFLTRRTLYLLVWDALTEDDYGRRDYWMRTIQSFADESPVIIVVNKCDMAHGRRREVEYEFLKRYPQIRREFYVSCKDDGNPGLAELRRYILSESVKLPLMKEIWTAVKLSIREDLEARSKGDNYIYYDEYVKICAARGLTEEIDQKSLIKQLHDLGIVIYYHNNRLLCNIVILSPQWGTRAVYKVLDEQQRVLKGRNGILYFNDLPIIWGNDTDRPLYPEGLYPYLLELMNMFQLAFKVDNPKLPDDTYLVAELLSENPVPHDWPPEGGEPLAFRYSYDFLPAGVMTRLIVSIHEYLETIDDVKQCWRKGAYLAHGAARAKMTLYDGIDKKYLDIRITGGSPRERRELLTIIRSHVKKINDRFSKIEITEQVPCRCEPSCERFFAYEDLLNAEKAGRSEIDCQRSWKRVSVSKLLDGVKRMKTDEERMKTDEERKWESKYGGIHADTVVINDVTGSHNDIKAKAPASAPAPDEKDGKDKPDPSEQAVNWSNVVFKALMILILLGLLGAALYLLKTGQISLPEVIKPFLGNLPEG